MALTPDVADGASAKAYTFDTLNTLATAGAIHSQWLNNGTALMTLGKDGSLVFGSDVGLVRSAAGVLKVTNGSTGYGDISSKEVVVHSPGTHSSGNGPLKVVNANNQVTFAVGDYPTATEGTIFLSAPIGQGTGSGIVFNSNVGDGTKVGTFQLDGGGNLVFRTQQGGLYFDNSGTGDIFFRTTASNTFRMTIQNSAGNVGIGTTSPTAQLHLVKADSSALTDFLINPTTKTSGNLIDAQVGGISKFSVNNAGNIVTTQYRLSAMNTAPASATDTGIAGEIRITPDYIYVCPATNTWVRAALATWP